MTTQNMLLFLPGRALAVGAAVMIAVAECSEADTAMASSGPTCPTMALGTVRLNVGPAQFNHCDLTAEPRTAADSEGDRRWEIYPGAIKSIDLKDGSTYVLDVAIDKLAETAGISQSVSFELTAVAEAMAA